MGTTALGMTKQNFSTHPTSLIIDFTSYSIYKTLIEKKVPIAIGSGYKTFNSIRTYFYNNLQHEGPPNIRIQIGTCTRSPDICC